MIDDQELRRRRRNSVLLALLLGTIAISVAVLTVFRLTQGDIAR